jgi:hypothetical protein
MSGKGRCGAISSNTNWNLNGRVGVETSSTSNSKSASNRSVTSCGCVPGVGGIADDLERANHFDFTACRSVKY